MSGNIIGHEDTEITLLTIRLHPAVIVHAFRCRLQAQNCFFGFGAKFKFCRISNEIKPIVPGLGRLSNSDLVYVMLQTFL